MIEELLICLRIAFEALMSIIGILLLYSWFSSKNKGKDQTEVATHKIPKKTRSQTIDKSTNTDFEGVSDRERTVVCFPEIASHGQSNPIRIPLGVPLRSRRGRGGYDKKKRHGGLWPDSGYESNPVSCEILEPPQTECGSGFIKERIGRNGGILALSGCFVLVPRNSLVADREIELSCSFSTSAQQDDDYLEVTPTISLGPNGQEFLRPVTIVLPTYYNVVDPNEKLDVKIQTKQNDTDEWKECKIVESDLQRKITFQVNHFTKFRGIVKKTLCHLLKKQLYYSAFLKRYWLEELPRAHTLVWCICDNLPHTVQQMTAEMAEHYERVVESETLELRYGQDVKLEISSASEIGVMPSTHTFNGNSLWPPSTCRKRLFNLHKADTADVDLLTFDFRITVIASGVDGLASTRDGTGSFRWAKPLSQQDPYFVTIIRDSMVTIQA